MVYIIDVNVNEVSVMGQVSHDLRGLLWFPIVFLKVLVGGSGWGSTNLSHC